MQYEYLSLVDIILIVYPAIVLCCSPSFRFTMTGETIIQFDTVFFIIAKQQRVCRVPRTDRFFLLVFQ